MRGILITREVDYAIRIVRALNAGAQKSAAEIVEEEGIPTSFAYKILRKLEKKSIVKSFRGANGGYKLLIPCSEMNLLDIIKAFEDNIAITECVSDDYECSARKGEQCSVHKEFLRIRTVVEEELMAKTIEELLSSS